MQFKLNGSFLALMLFNAGLAHADPGIAEFQAVLDQWSEQYATVKGSGNDIVWTAESDTDGPGFTFWQTTYAFSREPLENGARYKIHFSRCEKSRPTVCEKGVDAEFEIVNGALTSASDLYRVTRVEKDEVEFERVHADPVPSAYDTIQLFKWSDGRPAITILYHPRDLEVAPYTFARRWIAD